MEDMKVVRTLEAMMPLMDFKGVFLEQIFEVGDFDSKSVGKIP